MGKLFVLPFLHIQYNEGLNNCCVIPFCSNILICHIVIASWEHHGFFAMHLMTFVHQFPCQLISW